VRDSRGDFTSGKDAVQCTVIELTSGGGKAWTTSTFARSMPYPTVDALTCPPRQPAHVPSEMQGDSFLDIGQIECPQVDACVAIGISDQDGVLTGQPLGDPGKQSQVDRSSPVSRPPCLYPARRHEMVANDGACRRDRGVRSSGANGVFLPPDSGPIGAQLPVAHLRSVAGGIQ
jgi:hypothetical protein